MRRRLWFSTFAAALAAVLVLGVPALIVVAGRGTTPVAIVAGLIEARLVELDAAAFVRREMPARRRDAHSRRGEPNGFAGRAQAQEIRERDAHRRLHCMRLRRHAVKALRSA